MRNTGGYIAVARSIFDHPVLRRRAEWQVAWQWLIAAAAWKPRAERTDFGLVHLERGQLAITVRKLGEAWGWPQTNVHRFLRRLLKAEMIEVRESGTRSGTTTGTHLSTRSMQIGVVTICNYDQFQLQFTGARKSSSKVEQLPEQLPEQLLKQPLPLEGLLPPEPTNHQTSSVLEVDKTGEKALQRVRNKPPHGAKGRGMVWLDHGTSDWDLYAADYREVTGADKLPESRDGGRGNWFVELGQASARQRRRA